VRKIHVIGLALLVAAIMALPANAAMWVGGEIGANFIPSTDVTATGGAGTAAGPAVFGVKFRDVAFQPAVIGGLTVGYDFINTGFLGYAYPDWMKYFGFIVDFTYNKVEIRNQTLDVSGAVFRNGVNITNALYPNGKAFLFGRPGATSNGSLPCLSFLFYGHYGFFPDSVVPSGRVHPYLGVGPAIAWTNLDLGPYGLGGQTSTNIALAAEGGVRFVLLPNVTADIGLRYRYFTPSWSRSGFSISVPGGPGHIGPEFWSPAALKASVDSINSFSVLARVNYHF